MNQKFWPAESVMAPKLAPGLYCQPSGTAKETSPTVCTWAETARAETSSRNRMTARNIHTSQQGKYSHRECAGLYAGIHPPASKTKPLHHGGTETRREKMNGFLPDRWFIDVSARTD